MGIFWSNHVMNKEIPSSTSRLYLVFAVVVPMIISAAVLVIKGSGGSLVGPAMIEAFKFLLEFYLPMISIISAFYFAENNTSILLKKTNLETFVVAIIIVSMWTFLPAFSLIISVTYQDAFALTQALKGYGDAICAAALVFYFVQSNKAET